MEFWGVEVKSGEPLKVKLPEGMFLHLSQASLGECKKANESVPLFLDVDGKKLVLATLFSEKLPQQQLDLVFDKELELSHNWKSGSVYFYGYMARSSSEDEGDDVDEFDSSSDEDISLIGHNNGNAVTKVKEEKPADARKGNAEKDSGAGKQKVTIVEPTPKADEDDESSEEDDSMSEDEIENEDDSSDSEDDESDDSDEEETPKKVETGKKRGADSALKTPGQDKKAKLSTPQKTDGKKAPHVATPHPSKQAGKTPANKNQQTPKSGGSHSCKSCNKTFNSENALESHTKAKHSAAKAGK